METTAIGFVSRVGGCVLGYYHVKKGHLRKTWFLVGTKCNKTNRIKLIKEIFLH